MRSVKLSFIIPAFIILLVLSSCIALKPTGKTSYLKQVYHDITARNNGYFNADERLKKVKENIESTRKDDYNKILSVYTDRDPELAKAYSGDLDEVIKKTSVVVTKHTPSIYTPNSYFLIGVAYFLKGDMDNAVISFQYVNTEFKYQAGTLKKPQGKNQKGKGKSNGKPQTAAQKNGTASTGKSTVKRKGNKPMTKKELEELQKQQAEDDAESARQEQLKHVEKDSASKSAAAIVGENKGVDDFWHWAKHNPIRPDAMIWLVNTYTEQKKYKEAEAVLTIIDADRAFPAWQKIDVEVARANLFVKKADYARAIPPLTWLTLKIKQKHRKIRYEYILAQIYEQLNNNPEAIGHYKKVLDSKPLYQMSFNAKMSLARIALKDNSMPTGDVVKLLKSLLKDSKNKEFYDQVYFALAELTLKYGDRQEAIGYYKKCIETSTANTSQKAQAYLRLGELYFEDEKYVVSQPYYDSTLGLIAKDNPKKPEVDKRNSILKNLVTQIRIIHDNDSLIKLASMSQSEREQYVEDQIRKRDEEKEQKDQQDKLQFQNNNPTNTATDPTGAWYFDNLQAKATGYNDFVKRWGATRKLDDNWRRIDKSSFDTNTTDTISKEAADSIAAAKSGAGKEKLTEKEKLLKNIPTGDAEVTKAKDKIVDAYYSLGNIYSIELKNTPKAIATFDELLKRFPDNKLLAETWYNLYLLYAKLDDKTKADYYKNLVLNKYPNSKFANIIRDPDYLNKEAKANNVVSNFYDGTYQFYLQGVYDSVFSRKLQADTLYRTSKLKPRFDLLEAFAIGKTKDLKTYKESLQNIVKLYPSDAVKIKAEEILKYIEKSTDSTVRIENNKTRYEYSAESRHFVVVDFKTDSLKATDVILKLSDYNVANFSSLGLKLEPLILPDGNTVISIKSFENVKKAKEYYDALSKSNTLANFPQKFIKYLMISDINMNKVIINKEINSYFDFFNVKYIK